VEECEGRSLHFEGGGWKGSEMTKNVSFKVFSLDGPQQQTEIGVERGTRRTSGPLALCNHHPSAPDTFVAFSLFVTYPHSVDVSG